ncbi:MAG: phage portal protein, partial [Actinomycetota bacterium]
DTDQPTVLTDPNPEITYHEFWSQVGLSVLDEGNAGIWVSARDSQSNPSRLHLIPWDEITVNWQDDRKLYRVYSWRNKTLHPNEDFIHIAVNRPAGQLSGVGPVTAAQSGVLATARAEEDISRSMVQDNFTPQLIVKHPSVKTSKDANRVRDIFESDRSTRRNRPSVTDTITEFEQLKVNLQESQWIESRNFTVQQIGRYFGLNGQFLLVESGSSLTYSTTETLFRQFLTQTLRPTYLERIEQSISRLLPFGKKARFNADEILRADITSRYQAHQIGVGGHGFITVNEVRASEGLSAIPGGDELIALSTQPKDTGNHARELAEIIQKVYLGVGKVITS